MICTYHNQNVAVVNCNGCGKPLCQSCDHRIKGFPFCQDCIVMGVELLRNQQSAGNNNVNSGRTPSPVISLILSIICPGLGAAYNGQTSKALVYFAVFAGLFQMAILTSGMPLFVIGFFGMWLFAAIDSWRIARLMRTGVNVDGTEDILVQRLSGNPRAWGIILTVLGLSFFLQAFMDFGYVMRGLLPIFLIGLGIYLLRDFFMKPKEKDNYPATFGEPSGQPMFLGASNDAAFRSGNLDSQGEYPTEVRSKRWKNDR